jgi:hypothetical protein
MSSPAVALLESALRARKLDRTLTTAIPPGKAEGCVAATTIAAVDQVLQGGLPRGQLSEIAGPASSGRTTLLLQVIAAATRRGEIAAIVDTFDRLDVASVVAAGTDLDRLLWIRGPQGSGLRPQSDARGVNPDPFVDRALKALNLVLQAGGFGVAALDLGDATPAMLNRIPFTTWLRVQRAIEGSDTACVLVAPQPLARSAGGVTLAMGSISRWAGDTNASRCSPAGGHAASAVARRRLEGLDMTVRVVSPRRRVEGATDVRGDLRG